MSYFKSFFAEPVLNFIYDNQWLVNVFCLVFMTGVIYYVVKGSINKLIKKTSKSSTYYYKTFLEALQKPLLMAIWLIGIGNAAVLVSSAHQKTSLLAFVPPIVRFGVLLLCAWFVLRFIKKFEKNYIKHAQQQKKSIDKTVINAVSLLLTISTVVTTGLAAMQVFGLPISGLLAFGGIGGAAVAFASKDLLANFFGGLVVYLDSPFKIGDWIKTPDGKIEGTVEYIGWRACCIRTFDKRALYVPNGLFLTLCVENPSRMTHRRIKTLVGVRYDDAKALPFIIKDIKQMLTDHPDIDNTQTMLVNFTEFGASSLNILIYTFSKTTAWAPFKDIEQDVYLKIIDIIDAHGAECAFPTQTLHIPDLETKRVN